MGGTLKIGVNDLLSQRPDLAAEWHPTKNGSLLPQNVCVFSSKRVWWQITAERFGKKFILEWEASVANRACGSGCPYISTPPKKLLPGFNDLQSTNPELAAKWHPEKNKDLTPDMIFENTCSRFWWQHKAYRWGKEFTHEWLSSPKNVKKGENGCGCPICHGTKVLPGYNDLRTCFPELCEEWDDARNAALGLTPETVTPGSNKRVYWLCSVCGHSWESTVLNRTAKQSHCPGCALRKQTSFAEQALYFYFSRAFANCVHRDRSALSNGELDIYLPEHRFAVEYCGLFSHASEKKKIADAKKREECERKGIHLVFIYESDHEERYLADERLIVCAAKNDYSHLGFVVKCLNEELKRLKITDKSIEMDLDSDEFAIREQYQRSQVSNSIAMTHPHLLDEWDYEKNGSLKPQGFSAGSGVSVYWKHTAAGKNGEMCCHSWKMRISKRTQGQRCPVCAGKIVQPGYNDLFSANPAFLAERDYERNTLSPTEITPYSRKTVWWKHDAAADGASRIHRWKASPNERMHGGGCAICAGKIAENGIEDPETIESEAIELEAMQL